MSYQVRGSYLPPAPAKADVIFYSNTDKVTGRVLPVMVVIAEDSLNTNRLLALLLALTQCAFSPYPLLTLMVGPNQ